MLGCHLPWLGCRNDGARGSHREKVRGQGTSHREPGKGGRFPELAEATVLLASSAHVLPLNGTFISLCGGGRKSLAQVSAREGTGRAEATWRQLKLFFLQPLLPGPQPWPLHSPPPAPWPLKTCILIQGGCRLQGSEEDRKYRE